jgi:hypothetical protein
MKALYKVIIILSIVFVLSLIAGLAMPINIEIRNVFYQVVLGGYIAQFSFILIVLLFFIRGFLFLTEKKWAKGIILILITGFFLMICLLSLMFIRDIGVFKEDLIIYQNQNEKIIYQYFETGITGNPRHRIILTTDDLNSGLRKFKLINEKEIKEEITRSEYRINCNSIPKEITYKEAEFRLVFCAQ